MFHALWGAIFAEPWLTASAIIQLVPAVLGAVVTLHEDWAKRHRVPILVVFVVAAIIGLLTTVRQGINSGEASAKLSSSLDNLGKATEEISRVTSQNTELQEKLLKQGQTIADLANRNIDLSKESIDAVTGGGTYCYIVPGNAGQNEIALIAIAVGTSPLHEVIIDRMDSDEMASVLRSGMPPTFRQFMQSMIHSYPPVPFITASNGRLIDTLDLGDAMKKSLHFNFFSINGMWSEQLKVVRGKDRWIPAIRVTRASKKPKGGQDVLYQYVDPNYPTINGAVDW